MQKWLRRLLALVALVGSVFGLYWVYIYIGVLSIGGGTLTDMLLTALGGLLFVYGLMCGFWLLEGRDWSVSANLFFWALQLPVIVTPLLSYKLFALVNLSLFTNEKFASLGLEMNGPKSPITLMLGDGGKAQLFGVNLFALLMVLLLIIIAISGAIVARKKDPAGDKKH